MADLYRLLEERFDRSDKQLDQLLGKRRATNQRLADRIQQPRLTTEADVDQTLKTRKRTEGAATDRAKHGDSSCARVDDGPTSVTSCSMIAEPLLLAPENASMAPWPTKALKRQSHIFHPWRYACCHLSPVA